MQRLERGLAPRNGEPAFGCHFLAPLGNNTGGVRLHVTGDGDHLFGCRHLEIERQSNGVLKSVDIRVPNMAPVLAKVRCDAVRAGRLGGECRPDRVGMGATTRVSHGRHMIDVHTKAQIGISHFPAPLSEPSLSPTTASARLSFSGLRPARRNRAAASLLLRCRRQPSTAQ